jgi:hypothetical protein
MTQPEIMTMDALREAVLAGGYDDFVSMADVQADIFGGHLKDMSTEQRQLVVDTVRSLLEDDLVEVGDIPGRDDPGFMTWPGTIDEVMTQFVDRFIGCHQDPLQWQYRIWLNLTEKGRRASAELAGDEPE